VTVGGILNLLFSELWSEIERTIRIGWYSSSLPRALSYEIPAILTFSWFEYFPGNGGENNLTNGEHDFQHVEARNEIIGFGAK
jgi:hypothetical protein